MPKGHWLVKQEPTAYSWDQFVSDGGTSWDGVRNFQARNNLKAMKKGDLAGGGADVAQAKRYRATIAEEMERAGVK